MKAVNLPFSILVAAAVLFVSGCSMTMEQRWEAFDTRMRQEIGVKTEDYYVREWGKPAKNDRPPMAERSRHGNFVITTMLRVGIRTSRSALTES